MDVHDEVRGAGLDEPPRDPLEHGDAGDGALPDGVERPAERGLRGGEAVVGDGEPLRGQVRDQVGSFS